MKLRKLLTVLVILILVFAVSAFSIVQNDPPEKSIFDVMAHTEVLDIELYTNFFTLDSLKKTKTYQAATLSFEDAEEVE